jgi:putative transposase
VLNKRPKSQQSKVKRALQEIWMAETKKDALVAFDVFIETWGVKFAVRCSPPSRALEASSHDQCHRNSFATVRRRTVRSKGCLSNKTASA